MSFADLVQADRRLMILRALGATAGFGANRALIRQFLDSEGHAVSRDLVDAEVTWLTEMGCVSLHEDAVKLTARGDDVATGRSKLPGVRCPQPGE